AARDPGDAGPGAHPRLGPPRGGLVGAADPGGRRPTPARLQPSGRPAAVPDPLAGGGVARALRARRRRRRPAADVPLGTPPRRRRRPPPRGTGRAPRRPARALRAPPRARGAALPLRPARRARPHPAPPRRLALRRP